MDKTPDFGLPFFYRVVLPGGVVATGASPVLSPFLSAIGIGGRDQLPYLVGLVVLFGFVLSLLDDPIYQILEGRAGWPKWLATWRSNRWRRLVKEKMARQDELEEDDPQYAECWYLLRQFPVDRDGNPTVTQPSRIGNVIAAYEQYPNVRYGMDSVFYWPRLWLLVDKDTRDEVDNPWAAVDAILYIGFGSGVLGIGYLVLALTVGASALLGFSGLSVALVAVCMVAAAALFVVFFACIRLSISGLVVNGEKFKSLFDLYRSKLALTPADDRERAAWLRLRNELQYGLDTKGTDG